MKRLLLNPERLLAELEKSEQEEGAKNAVLRERAESLRAEVHKSDVKLATLLDMRLEGDIDRRTYKQKRRKIEAATQEAKQELAEVQRQLQRPPLTEEIKKDIVAYCARMTQEYLRDATFEDKRQFLLMFHVKVTHLPEEEAVKVEGTFPTKKLSLTSLWSAPLAQARPSWPVPYHPSSPP